MIAFKNCSNEILLDNNLTPLLTKESKNFYSKKTCPFIRKETLVQVFSGEFCEICKNFFL